MTAIDRSLGRVLARMWHTAPFPLAAPRCKLSAMRSRDGRSRRGEVQKRRSGIDECQPGCCTLCVFMIRLCRLGHYFLPFLVVLAPLAMHLLRRSPERNRSLQDSL